MEAKLAVDVRAKMKDYMDIAYNGEPVIVSRRENQNVVIVSEQEYNELQKAKRNAEYLAKIDRSIEQLDRGEVVVKSFDELERIADE